MAKRQPKHLANPTFTQWLFALRPARYRALVDFALADRSRWPSRARTLLAFVRHVNAARTKMPDAPPERLVRLAYVAFEKDIAAGRKIESRVGIERLPDAERRTTHSYSLAPTTDARIRKIQAFLYGRGGSRGGVIDKLVDDFFDAHGLATFGRKQSH